MRTVKTILIIIAIVFPFHWFSSFELDGTKSWALGRYEWPHSFGMALSDSWKKVGIEPRVFAYEERHPYIYVYGGGGFTKILNFPFITYIEKLPNKGYYQGMGHGEKVSYASDTVDDMRKKYGSSLIIHDSFSEFSPEDQMIFRNMIRKMKLDDYGYSYNSDAVRKGYEGAIQVLTGLEQLSGEKIIPE